jgi:Tfp pilus assembly protein PilX
MKSSMIDNEKGVALVVALIMLIVLTLVGLSSIGTSIFETKISGHERFANNAFYAAEGGLEVGINRIPDLTAYSGNIGPDETYRSGRMTDSSAQPSVNLGLILRPGYETTWEFRRFQVAATGESFGARKEVEAQVLLGPYPAGTSYNN